MGIFLMFLGVGILGGGGFIFLKIMEARRGNPDPEPGLQPRLHRSNKLAHSEAPQKKTN